MHTAVTRRQRQFGRALLLILAALLLARSAEAAASCTISVTGVSFGGYDVFSATPLDSTGTITYRCSGNARNISVTLSKGGANSFAPRATSSGTDTLTYNLFIDAAHSTIWGDGTGGTTTHTSANPVNNATVVLTIYGRIPAGQDVQAGAYSDSVTAIINF